MKALFSRSKGDDPASGAAAPGAGSAESRPCPNCKAPLADSQDWCTQCGNRFDGRMRARAGWLSAGALVGLSAVLATTAAAAGIAALTEGGVKERPHTRLTLVTPTPPVAATTAPGATTPGNPTTLKTPNLSGTPTTSTTTTSSSTTTTTTSTTTATTGAAVQEHKTTTTTTTTTTRATSPEGPELEGVTAGAYSNDGAYSVAMLEEGEDGQGSSRAVEGPESHTAWKIRVVPGTSAHVNVGLLLDLHAATRVGSVEVHTSTPGFPLQVWGTTSDSPPASIGEWTLLGVARKLKHSKTIKLARAQQHWRLMLLWIPKVPSSQTEVALGEVGLFAPGS